MISYRGTRGRDLYRRAVGTATGIRMARLACDEPRALANRLEAGGIDVVRWEGAEGPRSMFETTAGFRLEAPAPDA